ncbi:MAG: 4Fe-4S binding protein [Bacteroidetes bacterium]|nr:4Fe-4S binding protein [Bacteroidota bacterium]
MQRRKMTKSIIIFLVFFAIGTFLWLTKGNLFYLFNFTYIGLSVSIGAVLNSILSSEKKMWSRKITQLMIGVYLLGVLGFLGHENMQIEGFFFYLLLGSFTGPVIHYFIAKIFGTLLFGRAYCGWACWTIMITDFLPWMKPQKGRLKYWGIFRYLHFLGVLFLILILWMFFRVNDHEYISFILFKCLIIGNLTYYAIAIILATILKDNRAFCKYACPIPVLMKFGTPFSVWKIKIEKNKCTECRLCEKTCPMNIKLLVYMKSNKRIASTECIACQQCVNICPENAVQYTKGFDFEIKQYINYNHIKKSE